MRCSARSFTRTGWNVPAPTCSVTYARFDAALRQRGEQRFVEVQSRGRCGDRAGRARVHRLVAGLVLGSGAWVMYGGSGTLPWRSSSSSTLRLRESAGDRTRPRGRAPRPRVGRPGCSALPARGGLLARTCASASRSASTRSIEHLDAAAARLFAEQARLDHAGVVEHQQVAGRRAAAADRQKRWSRERLTASSEAAGCPSASRSDAARSARAAARSRNRRWIGSCARRYNARAIAQHPAGMAELVDAADSKSAGGNTSVGFDSLSRHQSRRRFHEENSARARPGLRQPDRARLAVMDKPVDPDRAVSPEGPPTPSRGFSRRSSRKSSGGSFIVDNQAGATGAPSARRR